MDPNLLNVLSSPQAVAILLAVAVIALWRLHVKGDDIKDAALKTLTEAVGAFPVALRDLTAVVSDSVERERTRPKDRADDR